MEALVPSTEPSDLWVEAKPAADSFTDGSYKTGSPITLSPDYIGEQWRSTGTAIQTVNFSYVRNFTASTGTLTQFQSAGTAINALNFVSPTLGGGALNGNLATNQTALSSSLNLATPLAEGEYIFLRWADADQSGADHGLAIDNLSLTVVPEPVSITLIALGIGLIAFRIRRQA